MEILFIFYDTLGKYLLLFSLIVLFNNRGEFYSLLHGQTKGMSRAAKCKLLLKLLFVLVFGFGYIIYSILQTNSSALNELMQFCFIFSPAILLTTLATYTAKIKGTSDEQTQGASPGDYVIRHDRSLFWLFLVFFCISVGFLFYFFSKHENGWRTICAFLFAVGELFGILNALFWKVTVTGMEIIYHPTFGRTQIYYFPQITKAICKRSGAMQIYIGDKRILTFDSSLDLTPFVAQMHQLQIPIQE